MIFTSCCLRHPCRVHWVQYVRVCPRFPLPDSFPPGTLSWDGDWQKKKKKKKERKRKKREEGTDQEGAGASLNNQRCWDQQKKIFHHCSPPRMYDCVTSWWLQTASKVNSPHKVLRKATSAKRGDKARRGGGRELKNIILLPRFNNLKACENNSVAQKSWSIHASGSQFTFLFII